MEHVFHVGHCARYVVTGCLWSIKCKIRTSERWAMGSDNRLYIRLCEGETLKVFSLEWCGQIYMFYVHDLDCEEENGLEKELLVIMRLLWFFRRKWKQWKKDCIVDTWGSFVSFCPLSKRLWFPGTYGVMRKMSPPVVPLGRARGLG